MSIDTVTGLAIPMTAADKARWAALWTGCPDWCMGSNHEDDDWTEHVAEIGTVGDVYVVVVQPVDQNGQPTAEPGIKVTGEDRPDPMTPMQVDELIGTLGEAMRLVERIR